VQETKSTNHAKPSLHSGADLKVKLMLGRRADARAKRYSLLLKGLKMMVCVDIDSIKFNLRVGGIAIKDNCIMLNREINQKFWLIPGGRIECGEDSKVAIIREMKEEIEQDIRVVNLECMIENFFKTKDTKYHEIGIYYKIEVNYLWEGSRYIKDGNGELEYKWIKLEDLDSMILYPEIIKDIILKKKSGNHFIVNEY
jgi:ADP-ribose pyrophosphatase YjhB (NUDIX family)